MRLPKEYTDVVRYLYPSSVLPLIKINTTYTKNPSEIIPIYGAIGFDFLKLYNFETDSGDQITHHLPEPGTYFWGIEIERDEAQGFAGMPDLDEFTDAERFVLTSWGGYIPLRDNEIVIPYPDFMEFPDDMDKN